MRYYRDARNEEVKPGIYLLDNKTPLIVNITKGQYHLIVSNGSPLGMNERVARRLWPLENKNMFQTSEKRAWLSLLSRDSGLAAIIRDSLSA